MALFKIEKGNSADLYKSRPLAVEGYCYFTPDSGKFYIDAISTTEGETIVEGVHRIPLNAKYADLAYAASRDANGALITETYATINNLNTIANKANNSIVDLSVSGKVITYTKNDGSTGTITTQDTNITYTLDSFGVTATAAELNKLDGVIISTSELNYLDGATANIQAQLNELSRADHTHLYAGSASAGGPANSVASALSFTVGGVSKGSYDGSVAHTIDINAYDLNISSALRYIGRTNTNPATIAQNTSTITLVSGTVVDVEPGNVVIYTDGNIEFLYDDNHTWTQLGEASSFSLSPHIHGNVSNQGYLTDEEGNSLINKILVSDGTGFITGMATGDNGQALKLVDGIPTWSNIADTKNTAGSTDTSSKIFLIGATSQAANPQTYSHDTVYVDTSGYLHSGNVKVSVEGHTHDVVYSKVESIQEATAGGTISAPEFTGAEHSHTFTGSSHNHVLTPTTATIKQVSNVGTMFSASVDGEVLILTPGTAPTTANVTVYTGLTISAAAQGGTIANTTATGTISAPTFTGTAHTHAITTENITVVSSD